MAKQLLAVLSNWWTEPEEQKHRVADGRHLPHEYGLLNVDDIWLLVSRKQKQGLELMVRECIAGFEDALLETGTDKTFWTSTVSAVTRSLGRRRSWRLTVEQQNTKKPRAC